MTGPSGAGAADAVIVGRVRKAHGTKGELVIETITDSPGEIFAVGRRVLAGTRGGELAPDGRELLIEVATPFKGGLIVTVRGITDRVEADAWRGRFLLVPSTELAPLANDEIYQHELIGMRVALATGEGLGTVAELYELPQGLGIDVARPGGKGSVVLLYEMVVVSVDRSARTIVVDPPAGLLD